MKPTLASAEVAVQRGRIGVTNVVVGGGSGVAAAGSAVVGGAIVVVVTAATFFGIGTVSYTHLTLPTILLV